MHSNYRTIIMKPIKHFQYELIYLNWPIVRNIPYSSNSPTVYIRFSKLNMEDGSSLTLIVPEYWSVLFNPGRGIGTKTCAVEDVIPPDDLWFGTNTYSNYALIYNLYVNKCWGVPFVLRCLTDGGRGGHGDLPLPGTSCPVPDAGYIDFVWND